MNKKGIYKESGKILFGNKTRKHLVKQNRKAQIKKKKKNSQTFSQNFCC